MFLKTVSNQTIANLTQQNSILNIRKSFNELATKLFPLADCKETPASLERYQQHMTNFFLALEELASFDSQKDTPHQKRIYKIFADAPNKDIATKEIKQLNNTYIKNKHLVDAFVFFHDLGKFISNPNHIKHSLEKLYTLQNEKFNSIINTSFYQDVFKNISKQEIQLLEILIKYHNIGAINFDGNYGAVYKIELELDNLKLTPEEKNNFYKTLELVVALDRAAVADDHGEGYCTYYDFKLFDKTLHAILKNKPFQSADDLAQFVTNTIVMFSSNKQILAKTILPKIKNILTKTFTANEMSKIITKLNIVIKDYNQSYYLNRYLFHFAFNGDFAPLYKANDQTITNENLKKFTLIKIITTLLYVEELDKIKKLNNYPESSIKDVFIVQPQELVKIIKNYLNNNNITEILKEN